MPILDIGDGRVVVDMKIDFKGTREEFRERYQTITRWLTNAPAAFGNAQLGTLAITPEQLVNDQTYKTITGEELAATPEGREILGEELASRIDTFTQPNSGKEGPCFVCGASIIGSNKECAACNPGLGDTLAEDPKALDGAWICGTSLDDGEFSIGDTFATREDAIAAGPEELGWVEVGGFFQTAQLRFAGHVPDFPEDAEGILDRIVDSMNSEWQDGPIELLVDKMTPHLNELDTMLADVWTAWTTKHGIQIEGYFAEHIESHQLTQAMADEVDKEK